MSINPILFLSIPFAAISYEGFQVAELLVAFIFILELFNLKSRRALFAVITIISFYLLFFGLSFSALSQIFKALLLPLLCISLYYSKNTNSKCANLKIINLVIIILFLSLPLGLRLPFGSYIDEGTGFFRHSVDFAIFAIIATFYLFRFSSLPNSFSIIILFPAVLMGQSRILLPIISLYIFLRRPFISFIIISSFFLLFNILNIEIIPDKINNIIKLFIDGNIQEIKTDSSLMIRINNFIALFQNMSIFNIFFGLSREDIINITSSISMGDVSTDNIILYKFIFFGIPFGLFITFCVFISIWFLSRSFLLFAMLIAYGMMQDWLSNGFCIYILYVFFRYFSVWNLPLKRIYHD